MSAWMRGSMAAWVLASCTSWALAQTPPEKVPQVPGEKASDAPVPMPPPPPATAIAANVNGQEIPELAVYRGLLREHPKNWGLAKEVLHYLIDNVLVDQYLRQLKIEIEAKEVDDRFNQIKDEAKKSKQDFAEMLKKLHLTEPDLRKELNAALRWDKFVLKQGTDKVLLDYFQKNPSMFDGTQTQARHILVSAKDDVEGQVKIMTIKKGIDEEVARELAKLPPGTADLVLKKERAKSLMAAFASAAEKESNCPSKKQGGDLGWFRRVIDMVEPFARAAFALQPYQLSDTVKTEFGYHLILAVDRKPGREVKFDDVKPFVAEIYGERLREAIVTSYKPRSKVVVNEVMK